jgi:hypothetical protein
MSLYADDATVFINHTTQDLATTKHILQLFWAASGLVTKMKKTELFPIRCSNLNMEEVLGTE